MSWACRGYGGRSLLRMSVSFLFYGGMRVSDVGSLASDGKLHAHSGTKNVTLGDYLSSQISIKVGKST